MSLKSKIEIASYHKLLIGILVFLTIILYFTAIITHVAGPDSMVIGPLFIASFICANLAPFYYFYRRGAKKRLYAVLAISLFWAFLLGIAGITFWPSEVIFITFVMATPMWSFIYVSNKRNLIQTPTDKFKTERIRIDEKTRPCPHCGAQITAVGEFCPVCGNQIK